jgi:O-antigen/teichoic acid export membrane protein
MFSSSTVRAYLNTLGGSSGRLVIQAAYFVTLVSSLSVADYGVFASAIAVSLIVANGGTFGFTAALFRAATTRRRVLGHYIGGYYVYILGAIPATLAIAVCLHVLFFHHYLSMAAFLAIFASEAIGWRLVDTIHFLNLGLGRYAIGTAATLLASATRTVAALLFAALGSGDLETWSYYYLLANIAGAVGCFLLFQPRIRPRWNRRIFVGRLPESISFAAASLVQALQLEFDKILVLFLAGQKAAGIYALSFRIIDLIAVPVRSFFPIYTQMLLRQRAALHDLSSRLGMEIGVALTTTLVFVAFLQVLAHYPTLLGSNIAAAYPWFAALLVVPAAKLLLEYHRQIFFAANRVFAFTLITLLVLAIKIPAMAVIALSTTSMEGWIAPLNVLWMALYLLSAVLTWKYFAVEGGLRLRATAASVMRRLNPVKVSPPQSRR